MKKENQSHSKTVFLENHIKDEGSIGEYPIPNPTW